MADCGRLRRLDDAGGERAVAVSVVFSSQLCERCQDSCALPLLLLQNIPGRKDAAMSALAWCLATKKQPQGKLFSTGMDGNLTEWDMSSLQIKVCSFDINDEDYFFIPGSRLCFFL